MRNNLAVEWMNEEKDLSKPKYKVLFRSMWNEVDYLLKRTPPMFVSTVRATSVRISEMDAEGPCKHLRHKD